MPLLASAQEKPNIVFIFFDDLGYGDISSLSSESKIQTPNIDQVASEGLSFLDGHCSAAACTPSRYAALTGRYSWRTELKQGVLGGFSPNLVESDRATVASVLKSSGYKTAMFGKWHLGMNWPVKDGEAGKNKMSLENIDWKAPITGGPTSVGFDYYFGISASLDMPPYVYIENDRTTEVPDKMLSSADFPNSAFGRPGPGTSTWSNEAVMGDLTDRAIDYIKNHDKKQPFYIYLPFNSPHSPHVPIKEFQGKSEVGKYGDFVIECDYHVGRVMKALKDSGINDNTLVLISSDNGPERNMYRTRNTTGHDSSGKLLGAKRDNWEGGHRVPFIVSWPAVIKPGTTSDQVVSLVDWPATCAELASATYGADDLPDSFSFAAALRGEEIPGNNQRVYAYRSSKGDLAFRQGDWKLLTNAGSGGNTYSDKSFGVEFEAYSRTGQLYNIKEDPYEKKNLFDQNPEIVERILAAGTKVVTRGRTTDGAELTNANYPWPQLDWMNNWPPKALEAPKPKSKKSKKSK